MCVALPGRVVVLDADGALVEIGGRTQRAAALLLPDLAVGDDVLVLAGLIIARLPADEAAERRRLVDQLLGLVDDGGSAVGRAEEDHDH